MEKSIIEARIINSFLEVLGKAKEVYAPEYVQGLSVKANYRMRSSLGRAYLKTGQIDIHARAFQDIDDQYLNCVMAHEIAHVIAFRKYGNVAANHGPLFQETMLALGYEPNTYHDKGHVTAKFSRNLKKYSTNCVLCNKEYKVTKRKVLNLHRYRCKCGGELRAKENLI